jgi:hypothetical protein
VGGPSRAERIYRYAALTASGAGLLALFAWRLIEEVAK